MKFFRKYIRLHISYIILIYRYFMLKTDKKKFAFLFNFKSILIGSDARLSYDGTSFVINDKSFKWFSYKIRHQRQCDMAYQNGLLKRVDNLAEVYFLKKIDFKDGDIF